MKHTRTSSPEEEEEEEFGGEELLRLSAASAVDEPSLQVSTTKIYKFRPFEIWILLPKTFVARHGVTPEEVLAAGTNVQCVLESNPSEPVGPCVRCQSKKRTLITVRASSKAVFGPHEVQGATGVFHKYVFNVCRSQCTSSRDHLRSRVIAIIDGIRGLTLRTPPLVLRSREKPTAKSAHQSSSSGCAVPFTATLPPSPLLYVQPTKASSASTLFAAAEFATGRTDRITLTPSPACQHHNQQCQQQEEAPLSLCQLLHEIDRGGFVRKLPALEAEHSLPAQRLCADPSTATLPHAGFALPSIAAILGQL